jgi:hypothetical protein
MDTLWVWWHFIHHFFPIKGFHVYYKDTEGYPFGFSPPLLHPHDAMGVINRYPLLFELPDGISLFFIDF